MICCDDLGASVRRESEVCVDTEMLFYVYCTRPAKNKVATNEEIVASMILRQRQSWFQTSQSKTDICPYFITQSVYAPLVSRALVLAS